MQKTSTKRPGVIYELPDGRYGLAYNDEQPRNDGSKVYVRIFEDVHCEKESCEPKTKRQYVGLKHKMNVKQIGFID